MQCEFQWISNKSVKKDTLQDENAVINKNIFGIENKKTHSCVASRCDECDSKTHSDALHLEGVW